jgi:pimeloyl-ACP methyl ester carboxylesterase
MIDPLVLSSSGLPLIFIHANGYPPETYRTFLQPFLNTYQVTALYMRPFWPGSNPDDFQNWIGFREDYLDYLKSRKRQIQIPGSQPPRGEIIGVGHSLGAMSTIMAAIKEPDYFKVLVLIEPVLFSRPRGIFMRLISPFKIMRRFHPLVKGTLKRKTRFPDLESMYQNYRKKPIFGRLSDEVLRDYVRGLASENLDGSISLRYSPKWEARIYEISGISDWYVWRNLSRVKIPVLVIRGAVTDTLWASTLDQMVNKLPEGRPYTVKAAGHLAPLEEPQLTAGVINEFLLSLNGS